MQTRLSTQRRSSFVAVACLLVLFCTACSDPGSDSVVLTADLPLQRPRPNRESMGLFLRWQPDASDRWNTPPQAPLRDMGLKADGSRQMRVILNSYGMTSCQPSLGAGGMGEVCKAHDTRLDRTVAIKVLPEHVAADPDLKQRFEREAKTISSLNHPRIYTRWARSLEVGMETPQGRTRLAATAAVLLSLLCGNSPQYSAAQGTTRPEIPS